MNISEKIQKIVDDMPKVYDAGYVKGQESMVDESKIIKKTASAIDFLNLKDVSEIPHEVEIQLTSDTIADFSNTEVIVRGKNLWDKDRTDYEPSPTTGYYYFPIKVGAGNTVTFSFPQTLTTGLGFYALVNVNNTSNNSESWLYHSTVSGLINNKVTVTAKTDFVYLVVTPIGKFRTYIGNDLQIEISSTPTSYESFIEEKYTPNTNGKLIVKSISPIMNISTNESDINISANYHKSYGMQTEYDMFWDNYQINGKRTDYESAFTGVGWTTEIFKPKYDMIPTSGYMMFRGARFKIDLVEYLNKLGVALNFSKSANLQYTFRNSYFTHVGVIDARSTTVSNSLDTIFENCLYLVTIDKIILNPKATKQFNVAFNNCPSLENIVFEGEINTNGLNLQSSTKLSKDSIANIINVLSGTTSGLTITLSKTAVNNAFNINVDDESTYPEGTEFYELRHSKDNWTISYV